MHIFKPRTRFTTSNGMSRYRPGVAPVYPGICHPSRFIPVHPGCIKHFKTTGDMSRFNTVHPVSPRFSTVPPWFYPGSSRLIPDHRTGGSAEAWWLMPRTPDPEVGGSSPTRVKPCCVLEQGTFTPRKY